MSLLTEKFEEIWDAKSVIGVDPSSPAFIWKSKGSHAYKTTGDGQRIPYKKKKKKEAERTSNDTPMT